MDTLKTSTFEQFFMANKDLNSCAEQITEALSILKHCFVGDRTLLICGNGGSASDALHIVGELQKNFILPRKLNEKEKILFSNLPDGNFLGKALVSGLRAHSLVSESALISAIANDMGADLAFAQQVWASGRENDVLLAISTSGNSRNIVLAAQAAKARRMKIIGLTGAAKSSLSEISDVCIRAPASHTYRIQEYHIVIYHFLCQQIEEEMFL